MPKPTIGGIVKTSIVTAFTIAAALIWKDVISNIIALLVPPQDQLVYQVLAAIIATVIVVVAIYIILRTESEAEFVMKKLKDGRVKFVKAPPKEKRIKRIP